MSLKIDWVYHVDDALYVALKNDWVDEPIQKSWFWTYSENIITRKVAFYLSMVEQILNQIGRSNNGDIKAIREPNKQTNHSSVCLQIIKKKSNQQLCTLYWSQRNTNNEQIIKQEKSDKKKQNSHVKV